MLNNICRLNRVLKGRMASRFSVLDDLELIILSIFLEKKESSMKSFVPYEGYNFFIFS